MPEDLKLSQIGSSPLPPPFRGLHSPGVRKHCQIIFACYFRKSSINILLFWRRSTAASIFGLAPVSRFHSSVPLFPLVPVPTPTKAHPLLNQSLDSVIAEHTTQTTRPPLPLQRKQPDPPPPPHTHTPFQSFAPSPPPPPPCPF